MLPYVVAFYMTSSAPESGTAWIALSGAGSKTAARMVNSGESTCSHCALLCWQLTGNYNIVCWSFYLMTVDTNMDVFNC